MLHLHNTRVEVVDHGWVFIYLLVFIFQLTVRFDNVWMVAFVEELGTFVFFIITGYKFQPARNNPYLRLSQVDDEEIKMDDVYVVVSRRGELTLIPHHYSFAQSGLMENVSRVKRSNDNELQRALLVSSSSESDNEGNNEDVIFTRSATTQPPPPRRGTQGGRQGEAGPDIY
jgi:hypothetical protein